MTNRPMTTAIQNKVTGFVWKNGNMLMPNVVFRIILKNAPMTKTAHTIESALAGNPGSSFFCIEHVLQTGIYKDFEKIFILD